MRVHLNGQEGPIPTEALPDGSADFALNPITFRPVHNSIFVPQTYLEMGYTHYEVVCVGAAGGRGSIHYQEAQEGDAMEFLWSIGGAGGGGGMQKVAGSLAALPAECLVVVGEAGANGQDEFVRNFGSYTDVPNPTPGEDGGHSSFAGDVCMASGGKGGAPTSAKTSPEYETVPTGDEWGSSYYIPYVRPGGAGGDGGVGGRIEAGGGAEGGTVTYSTGGGTGMQTSVTWHTPEGDEGIWDGAIGEGGGGGSGGTYRYRVEETPGVMV